MTEKRYELVKDYDCDGDWEYAYQNNVTGRRYNFADEWCHYDFLDDVNNSYEKLKEVALSLEQSFNDEKDNVKKCNKHCRELGKENEQLKQRNNRQAKQLDNLYHLIEQENWEHLKGIIVEFQECEEQLQREWKTYNDGDVE